METNNFKTGDKVKNLYGETLTVLDIIGGTMIRVYEDFNNLYHYTKLTHKEKFLSL